MRTPWQACREIREELSGKSGIVMQDGLGYGARERGDEWAKRSLMARPSPMARACRPRRPMTGDLHEGPPLVAFDFDGTLTVRDSFTAFLKWRVSPARHFMGMVRLFPAALGYVFDRNRGKIKAAAVREFLRGVPFEQLEREARAFAQSEAPKLFRPDALAVWRRWRAKGAKLVIVTASPDVVVAPFARGLGADLLIGSQADAQTPTTRCSAPCWAPTAGVRRRWSA